MQIEHVYFRIQTETFEFTSKNYGSEIESRQKYREFIKTISSYLNSSEIYVLDLLLLSVSCIYYYDIWLDCIRDIFTKLHNNKDTKYIIRKYFNIVGVI